MTQPARQIPSVPLLSKAMPPIRRQGKQPRERVMALLDQAERHRITFLSAPQGYGKTTALTDWFDRREACGNMVAWMTVDRNDRDARCFWQNLHHAIERGVGDRGLRSVEEYLAMEPLEGIYTLANDLGALALQEGQMYLIVDCFDLLEGYVSMSELMTFVLALSGDVHVVLSSRTQYSRLSFEGHVISEMPLHLGTADLASTRDELRDALLESVGESAVQELSDADLDRLFEKTQGWPMAVEMALRNASGSADVPGLLRNVSGSDNVFWRFFEHEVFARMSEAEQDLLVKTSSIGVLRCRTVSYVLDRDDVPAVLQGLSQRGLFVAPMDARGDRYLVHPLFSEWLAEQSSLLGPDVYRRVNAKASHWFIRHGMVIPAAKHKILSTERESVLDLVRVIRPDVEIDDLMRLLWFLRVPEQGSLSVEFCLMAVWAYVLSADLDNMDHWERQLRELPVGERPADLDLVLDVLDVKKLCLLSRFEEGMRLMGSIEPRLRGKNVLPLRLILANCRAEALDQQGRCAEGMEQHRKFASLSQSGAAGFMGVINEYEMAYSLMEQGSMADAARACLRLLTVTPADHPVRGATVSLAVMIDLVQGVEGNHGSRLDQAKPLVSRYYNVDMYLDWCVARAWAYVQEGRVDQADEMLLEAMGAVKYSLTAIPRGTAMLPFQSRAMLKAAQGRFEDAEEVYREFDMTGRSVTFHSSLVRQGLQAITSGAEQADARLEELQRTAQEHGYGLFQVDLGLHRALLAFGKGQRTKACKLLHDCLKLAAERQIVAPFAHQAEKVRPLLMVYLTNAKPDYERRRFVQLLLRNPAFSRLEAEGDAAQLVGLTGKERQILELAQAGMGRAEIAEELCVSESTVKSHLSHMYRKFGVGRFQELVAAAADLGL